MRSFSASIKRRMTPFVEICQLLFNAFDDKNKVNIPFESPLQKRSGMARLCSQGISVLSVHPHVHLQSEGAISAFAFPAIAGTPVLIPEGWKAE